MLKTRFLKLLTIKLDEGRYLLAAQDEDGDFLAPDTWKNLVFSRHEESFFGTLLDSETVNGVEGIAISGWQLVTLFAKESFNRFVEWDWSEESEICLAAAHALYEGINEKDWLPDFSAWEDGRFQWQLPERVKDEFGSAFWVQRIGGDGPGMGEESGRVDDAGRADFVHSEGEEDSADRSLENGVIDESETALHYISDLYNHALDSYLTRNPSMKKLFGPKLDLLKKQNISSGELARYFDEESWLEWVGIRESPVPFSIGLQLDEPVDGEGLWSLDVFLRGKKNVDEIYGVNDKAVPTVWRSHLDRVSREQERWVRLIPWLEDEADSVSDGVSLVSEDGADSDSEGVSLVSEDGAKRLKSHLTEDEAWMFLTEASETLVALNVEILLPSWWQAMKNANLKVKASLKGTSSHRPSFVGLQAMLDFNWRFSMNGVDLSEDEFRGLVEEKRRLVYIRGRWVKLDPQFIRQIQDLMKQAEKEGLHIRDLLEQELIESPASEDELENPKAFARIQIELNRQWKQMVKQLSEIKEIPEQPVPESLVGELRPYQQLGMSWLWFLRQYGFGACLADDMGLGKTVQLIAYLLMVKEKERFEGLESGGSAEMRSGGDDASAEFQGVVNPRASSGESASVNSKVTRRKSDEDGGASAKEPTKAALIICPTSVLGNWQKELEKFSPSMEIYLHYGSNRLKEDAFSEKVKNVDVVLTSYGLSHLDSEEFHSMIWSTIAIDEAQNIKNAATKQSRAVRKLKGRHHIALTGTPMENRLSELWSIFDFTNHGYLGSLGQFQKKFVIPIEKDEKKEKVHELQSLIRPFLLRRTKKDEEVALNLPDKLEQKEYCPLTAEQASLYEQLVQDTFEQIEKLSGFERKGLILQMLSRLKQLCNHPALYLKEKSVTRQLLDRSNKLEKLAELIDAVLEQGESCLIFTQYIEMGEMIKALVKTKFGVEVPFLNGSVPKTKRDEMIEQFQNGEFPVFLLSLKAGGTGLNLTAANHVIHYDRWWNPAVENQATDRAYRIGQQRFVHVHKLICTGTLEEKIDAMLEKKQFLNDQIIQSENWITEMSTDELKDLVYLG
ncbi:DEAD/DEAH box helicase [Neobacillus sp. PS3-40]|uniref:DEAD/DEAH box helicase n=1 Tax=Neobacillus sp. PS3-40 TaxID=3070679 RepID=UPI0027E18941|nr:DEAD/DEAH box helicase [Neobacillus sp. PS3-40]WML46206.1 DEAD/DEAH box helicase [Neobacillus sp. PS3-40]